MVMRDRIPYIIPKSCGGRMSCIFLVFIPMVGALSLAGLWMYKTKQTWEAVEIKSSLIRDHTLHIGQLILDFNAEREWTVIYVTARTLESQMAAKGELDNARSTTDKTLRTMHIWPGVETDGHMFKSRYLFKAVLDRHRTFTKVGNNFQDELQFYTNIIDILFGWVSREVELFAEVEVWRWLMAYTYLMGSINYLGAEQALCSVFFSVICFSHRETFYYANYSFSGEAAFRLYRQSYPEERGGNWRITSHKRFFPNIFSCREEIFADMDYIGMSIDPSLCDYSRKNETKFHDTDILVLHENHRLKEALFSRMTAEVDRTAFDFVLSGVVLGIIACYFSVLHVLRCTFVKCVQSRSSRKWEPKDSVLEEDRLDSLTLDSKMIKYEEYNCKPHNSHIKIKVATV